MTQPFPEASKSDDSLTRLIAFYRQLDSSKLAQLPHVYHSKIVFIDPVSRHEGIEALEGYFSELLKKMNYCHFDVYHSIAQAQEASLFWTMNYSHPELKKGKNLVLEGTSYFRFSDEHVIYQRDYFDLGAMLYEHVPLIGNAVRALKSRLAE